MQSWDEHPNDLLVGVVAEAVTVGTCKSEHEALLALNM
jgi:hypothetical protein